MELKEKLEQLYRQFNTRAHVYSDPIEFLYDYERLKDREIAALVTASLAYGRVAQIKKSVAGVLKIMGPSPHDFLTSASNADLKKTYKGFAHRFAKTDHLVGLLVAIRNIVFKYGSLQECMMAKYKPEDETVVVALNHFVKTLISNAPHNPGHLLSIPDRGSAGKRLHLFLRWLVRKDLVDPGGWAGICPSQLIVPVDVHMHRIGTMLNFTQKKQANLKTAMDITLCFKKMIPHDPVKYDFALTRLGIERCPMDKLTSLTVKTETTSPIL